MQIQVCNPGTWFGRVTGIFVAFWSFWELVRLQSGRASSTKPAASLYNPASLHCIWVYLAPSRSISPCYSSSREFKWLHLGPRCSDAAPQLAVPFASLLLSARFRSLGSLGALGSLDSRALTLSPPTLSLNASSSSSLSRDFPHCGPGIHAAWPNGRRPIGRC